MFIGLIILGLLVGWAYGRKSADAANLELDQLKRRLRNAAEETNSPEVKQVIESVIVVDNPGVINSVSQTQNNTADQPSSPLSPSPVDHMESASYNTELDTAQKSKSAAYSQIETRPSIDTYMNNTSLLLYFGAFLFISSVGLFIGFATVNAAVKTLLVLLVAAALYTFGFYLYRAKKRLQQVGEAFIGMGMTAIPFIGITAYSYGSESINGALIAAITSAFAGVVYFYTIIRLKNAFVSYLLVGSIVSLLLSITGIVDGPVYYYVWALSLSGIVLQIISIFSRSIPVFKTASSLSGQLFTPLAIGASLVAIAESGSGQIAVTALLGSAYYLLLAVSETTNKQVNALASHSLLIGTIAAGSYWAYESFDAIGAALVAITVLHIPVVYSFRKYLAMVPEHFMVMFTASALAPIILYNSQPQITTLAIGLLAVLALVITYVNKLLYAFQILLTALVALSYASGQLLLSSPLSAFTQSVVSIAFLLPVIGALRIPYIANRNDWKDSVRAILTVGFGIAAAASMLSGAYQLMLVCIGIIILCILVYELDANPLWRYLELVFAALPLTVAILASDFAGDATTYLSVATVLLLVVAVGASVRHRLVAARIVSSIGWIILPIGLIADEVGGIMRSSENILALYIAVLFALSVSRAVALGRFMAPKSAPVSSLTQQSSMSYLLGMIAASVIVAIASFTSGNAIVGIASLLAATSYLLFHFWYFEKSNYFAALLPITLQIILIRMVEPYTSSSDNTIVIFSLVSSLLALAACAYTAKSSDQNSNGPIEKIDIQKIALASLYFAPLSIVFAGEVLWTMPLTALIATVVTLIYFRNQEQSTVEALGGLVLSAVFWIFYFAGLRDVQFYTHMIAGLFALYAYFRHVTRDEANTHNYIIAALSTSTVPLALEALGSSERGEILGLWLLLEQVGFLVLGVTIKQPLLTKWGLYVGVAAVIYQLRDLGWAMLAVLSLFIIGVATYRALRQPNDENKE